MPYDPTVAHISTHISALGNTPVLIHFTLCIVWHIDQSEPIEHSVDVGHAPDIAQRFWTVNHCSDLFHIAQRQQHRAPRQTFAVFPAVDPELSNIVPCTNPVKRIRSSSLANSFNSSMHHIVFSKCTVKRCKSRCAYRCKAP